MIQWDWNTQPISGAKVHVLANKIGVVQDIPVREGGTLWIAGSAAGELNVDGVMGIQLLLHSRQLGNFGGSAQLADRVKVMHPSSLFGTHTYHMF